MNIPRILWPAIALVAAASIAGCSTPVKLAEPAPVETRTPTLPESTGSADAAPKAASTVTPVDLTAGTSKPAMDANLGRIVYFDFDSFAIKDEFRPVIDGHARALKSSAQKKEIVEGHTDERGGREYNLALGQKRAEAVVKSLVLLGAADGQLEAISYGKERPAVQGSDEAAWAKNRRAELRDR